MNFVYSKNKNWHLFNIELTKIAFSLVANYLFASVVPQQLFCAIELIWTQIIGRKSIDLVLGVMMGNQWCACIVDEFLTKFKLLYWYFFTQMMVPTAKKYMNEDEDDDDLEALRLAALKSLRAKPAPSVQPQQPLAHQNVMQTGHSHYPSYNQRFGRREYYPNRPPRQNGVS